MGDSKRRKQLDPAYGTTNNMPSMSTGRSVPLSPEQLITLKQFGRIGFSIAGKGILTWLKDTATNYRQLYFLGEKEAVEMLSRTASSTAKKGINKALNIDWTKAFLFMTRIGDETPATILMPVLYDLDYRCEGSSDGQNSDLCMKIKSGKIEQTVSIDMELTHTI